jgi:hypothetical protein
MSRRTGTNERLGHKLMDVLPFLVWIRWLVTELLNSSLAYGFHVAIDVSTSPVCEACGHASTDKLKPVILRMQWPRCQGHTSWLPRLNIIHAI